MENNPIKQRVHQLTEMWNESVTANKDVRIFGWVGASSVDYKMIRGFVLYHTSDESNIEDVFLCFHHPFKDSDKYGSNIVYELGEYINAWNKDEQLSKQTCIINWKPDNESVYDNDEAFFAKNVNLLADALQIQEGKNYLVLALFPQNISSYNDFSNWLINIIKAGLSAKVRIMVYDTYELKAFEFLRKEQAKHFLYLYPDLDMAGAMNQILESAKQGKKNEDEKDAVLFQQLLLQLTNAISYTDHQKVEIYRKQCISIAQKHNWPHMEALVYFFIYSYYYSNNEFEKAIHVIEKAILKADDAVALKIVVAEDIRYQYRIAKGNLFFINKNFSVAAEVYQSCLELNRKTVDKQVLLGIYQMLGASRKNNGEKKAAWRWLEEGWSLIGDQDEFFVKGNIMLMLYGKDMIEAGKDVGANVDNYYFKMNEWWGENWMKKVYNYQPTLT